MPSARRLGPTTEVHSPPQPLPWGAARVLLKSNTPHPWRTPLQPSAPSSPLLTCQAPGLIQLLLNAPQTPLSPSLRLAHGSRGLQLLALQVLLALQLRAAAATLFGSGGSACVRARLLASGCRWHDRRCG